jgi:subtilisin-like proprotein convertase family protein
MFPEFPPEMRGNLGADGENIVAQTSLITIPYDRAAWLNEHKARVGSWVDSPDAATLYALSYTYSADNPKVYELGTFYVSPVGNAAGEVTVAIMLGPSKSGGAVPVSAEYYEVDAANGWQDTEERTGTTVEISAGLTTAWNLLSLKLPRSDRDYAVRLTSTPPATCACAFWSICIFGTEDVTATAPDGGRTSFIKCDSRAFAAEDQPFSAYKLDRIAANQNHMALRYQRVLASHSFAPASAVRDSNGATDDIAYFQYLTPYLTTARALTLYVYAKVTSGGAPSGVLELSTAPHATGTFVSRDTEAVTSTTGAWHTLTVAAGVLAAADQNRILVGAQGDYDAVNNVTIEVSEIVLIETEDTATDWVYNSGGRNAPVPEHLRPLNRTQVRTGMPIVASYDESVTQDKWSDLFTAYQNSLFPLHRRARTLVFDHVKRESTSGAYPQTLVRVRHLVSRGCRKVDLFVKAYRKEAATSDPHGVILGATINGSSFRHSVGHEEEIKRGGKRKSTWRQIARNVPVTEGDLLDVDVLGGFVDGEGVADASAGGDDALKIEGVVFREHVATELPRRVYFWQRDTYSTSNTAATGGGTLSKVITPDTDRVADLIVRHVRLRVVMTHAVPGDVVLRLSHNGTDVDFKSTSAVNDAWYSDDRLDDTATSANLSGLAGVAASGAWTLRLTNNSGVNLATLTAWELEVE